MRYSLLSDWEETTNASHRTADRSFHLLLRRLARAGYSKDFVYRALLPDWWNEQAAEDVGVLQDVEIRVARFLGTSIDAVGDSSSDLIVPAYPSAQLRRVRDVGRDRMGPAIHAAMRIAGAAARSLHTSASGSLAKTPPADGRDWRKSLISAGAPTLETIASDLWNRGIPVIPLDVVPTPTFQGLACIVSDRPAILLGHRNDEPGRVGFVVAHEAGHVAAGDCEPDAPIVDEEDSIRDDSPMEQRAEAYAIQVLVGDDVVPQLEAPDLSDYKRLAQLALEVEQKTGADASAVVFAWARRTLDYGTATMAVRALCRASGARNQLGELFLRHVDIDSASETDRDLLRCVHGVVGAAVPA